jgi:hypothetical protein
MPITQLEIDCHLAGLKEIAEKAKNGEYDATEEEADEWFKKNNEMAREFENLEILKEFKK